MEEIKQIVERLVEKKASVRKTTPSVTASRHKRTATQREINLAIARAQGASAEGMAEAEREIRALFEILKSRNGEDHPNPPWLIETMACCVEGNVGTVEKALMHAIDSQESADNHVERAISHGNTSECLRLLGRYPEAVEEAIKAIEANPGHLSAYSYLVMALYRAGEGDLAAATLEKAVQFEDITKTPSLFRVHMQTYPEYGEMSAEFESVRALFVAIEAAEGV